MTNEFDFNKLRLLRKYKGYTQTELSSLLGISQSTYARLEKGDTHSWEKHIYKICKILKVKTDYFITNKKYLSSFNENNFFKTIIIEINKQIEVLEKEIEILKKNK